MKFQKFKINILSVIMDYFPAQYRLKLKHQKTLSYNMTSSREIICRRDIDIFQINNYDISKDLQVLINKKHQNVQFVAWCLKIRQLVSKLA